MRRHIRGITALAALGVLAACSSSSPTEAPTNGPSSDPPPPPTSAGVVSGTARDTKGQPISGALVWVEPAVTTGLLTAHTGSNGAYSVTGLARLPYTAKAWTQVSYRGKNFCLRLASSQPSDYDSFVPTTGVVRNFQWKLTGQIPDLDNQFFGGEIELMGDGSAPSSDDVELRLVPTAPLIDGSTGQTLTRTVSAYGLVQDVPAGAYTATATLIGPGGTRTPLAVGRSYGSGAASMPIEFLPASEPSCGNGSGLERAYVYWSVPGSN
jgi:hypothetical protein